MREPRAADPGREHRKAPRARTGAAGARIARQRRDRENTESAAVLGGSGSGLAIDSHRGERLDAPPDTPHRPEAPGGSYRAKSSIERSTTSRDEPHRAIRRSNHGLTPVAMLGSVPVGG